MELPDPRLSCVLYWRVQEDDLVLYPDFVDDRLQCHVAFEELPEGLEEWRCPSRTIKHYLFFLNALATSSFVRNVPQW